MNKKFIVPFKTAQLLKKAGCDCVTNFYYRSDGNFEIGIEVNNNILQEGNIAAPAYCELIEWFLSKGIYIDCNIYFYDEDLQDTTIVKYWCDINSKTHEIQTGDYDKREDALNVAVLEAIKIL